MTDADVEAEIGQTFNYFGGELPTPLPTATATVQPTPSVTPIPTAVITDEIPTNTPAPTVTVGPTSTPLPTATAVSAEAFQEEFGGLVDQFEEHGVSEEQYREIVRNQIYRERLIEVLNVEDEISDLAQHASFFVLQFDTEEEANEAQAMIEASDYLSVWNEIRSTPADLEAETPSTAQALENVWVTEDTAATRVGAEVAEAAFSLPVGEVSDVISRTVTTDATQYYLIQVTGREERPLSASELQTLELENLAAFIDEQLTGSLTLTEYDRGRAPTSPVLDPLFTAAPTATPPVGGG